MSSRTDAAARSLIRYFQQRAKRGQPEARRDWLYGPAHIPPGLSESEQEQMLNEVIRRAKDIGAAEGGFELIYVYVRAPVWTCQPTDWVRDINHQEELKRERAAQLRLAACAPSGSPNASLAAATAASLDAAFQMLRSRSPRDVEPSGDSVLQRIDLAGIAN